MIEEGGEGEADRPDEDTWRIKRRRRKEKEIERVMEEDDTRSVIDITGG